MAIWLIGLLVAAILVAAVERPDRADAYWGSRESGDRLAAELMAAGHPDAESIDWLRDLVRQDQLSGAYRNVAKHYLRSFNCATGEHDQADAADTLRRIGIIQRLALRT